MRVNSRWRFVVGTLAASAFTAVAGRGHACGVSATGVASCSLAEHEEAERPHFAIGLAGLATRTVLRFDESLRAEQLRYAVLADLAYMPTRALAFDFAAGAALGGSLEVPNGTHEFSAGPALAAALTWRFVEAPRYFALFTSQLAFVTSRTRLGAEPSTRYSAFDLRLGAQLGLNLAGFLHPFVLARAFGGPVFWRYEGTAVTGTDIHHYQVGAGCGFELAERIALVAEVVPLGEQALAAGASFAF
jgi:hypothetical protein